MNPIQISKLKIIPEINNLIDGLNNRLIYARKKTLSKLYKRKYLVWSLTR